MNRKIMLLLELSKALHCQVGMTEVRHYAAASLDEFHERCLDDLALLLREERIAHD